MPPVAPPSNLNLSVGSGIVLCERYDANGVGLGMNHMGNVDTFSITVDTDIITKRQSMTKSKGIYAQIARHVDPKIKIVASEFTVQNVTLALLGTNSTLVQAATAVTAEAVMPATIPGAYFKTAKLGPISAITVKFGVTSGVLGTDYAVTDATVGLIQILPTTILTGAVTVDYTPTAYTSPTGPSQIAVGASPLITCKLVFIGDPLWGSRRMIQAWKVSMAPDGAHDLITDDLGNVNLTGTVLDDSINHPAAPFILDTYLAA